MADPVTKLTSENAIPPGKFVLSDPKDAESGCKCDEKGARNFKCSGGEACAKAEGSCRMVYVSPGDPHLRLVHTDKTKGSDDKETFIDALAPGWRLTCVCLKFTGKDPTDAEKAKWPAMPKWEPPKGYKFPAKFEPCAQPTRRFERELWRWYCHGTDCQLVGVEKDSKQLVILYDRLDRNIQKYAVVFSMHLDNAP